MKRLIISLLTIGGFLQASAALPQAQAPANNPNLETDARARNARKCVVYDPIDLSTSLAQCKDVCGDEVAKAAAAGQYGGMACIAFGDIKWEHYSGSIKVAPANCSCNNSFINWLAESFIEALPTIAEIGCNILMAAVKLVVEVGALAIPGVGEAIDGGMIAGIEAAKLAAYSYDAGQAGLGAFSNFLNPCGTSHLPDDLKKAFDIMNSVSPQVLPKGFKVPKGVPKGGGKPGDKGDPNPPKEDPPKKTDPPKNSDPPKTSDPPKKTDPPKNSDPPKTTDKPQSTTDKACTRQKRAPGGKNNNDCNDDKEQHVTEITKSTDDLKTITETCSGSKYPQACYHYYSAIHNHDWVKSTYACIDKNEREPGQPTSKWTEQHADRTWWTYTKTDFKFQGKGEPKAPRCQADEFPPAYFMPPGAKEKKLGQIVRWLPGSENSTAANTEWKKFCTNHDGGAGNGQFHGEDNNKGSKGQVNEDLVSLKGPGKEIKHKGPNDKTTTTTQYEAKYTRAVFEIKFDQLWPTMPSGGNDWGLKENPCWPEDIVPDDPGFVLLTDDPWYTTAASEKVRDQVKASLYATRPPKEMKDRADKARDQRGQKRPHSPDDNGPNKQPAGNPPSKRALEIIDGFAIRDVNITRRLTDKEVERNVEIIQCADRTCSEERRILGEEDGVLVIRGEGPSMTPPTNVDTVPTIHPRAATTLEIRVDKRNLASPELPEATVAAS